MESNKKFLTKKIILRFIALFVIASVAFGFSSCSEIGGNGGDTESPSVTEPPHSETEAVTDGFSDRIVYGYGVDEAAKVLQTLPDADMEGAATVIATVDHADIFCPDEAADEISAAVLKRNKYVEEKYSTSIVAKKEASHEALLEAVRTNKDSGMYYSDILALNASELGAYVDKGLLLNIRSLPGIDLEADFYNSEAMSQLSAGYKLYAVSGEVTSDARNSYAVFYNKALAEQLGISSLYDTVRAREWTWDSFASIMKTAAAARGTDAATAIGAVSDLPWQNFADALLMTSGIHYIDTTYGSVPAFAVGEGVLDAVIEKARGIFAYGEGFRSGFDSDSSAISSFRAGDVLFYVGKLSDAEILAPIEVSWGVLPLPSYSAERWEYTACDPSNTAILATTANNTLTENTALMIQALNAVSARCMGDAVTEYIQNTSLRDNDSIEMVRLIASKIQVFDFTDAFPGLDNVISATSKAYHNAVEGRSFKAYHNIYATAGSNLLKITFTLDNAE